ncbi:MAG: helix-turn-helix transcriptional regulator [Chloroflexota bacterium]
MALHLKRFVALRKETGMSQYALADALGLTQNQIARYELGESNPKLDTLIQFADFFHTSTDYLLGRSDERHPEGTATRDLTPTEVQLLALIRGESAAVQGAALAILRTAVKELRSLDE